MNIILDSKANECHIRNMTPDELACLISSVGFTRAVMQEDEMDPVPHMKEIDTLNEKLSKYMDEAQRMKKK